jgi:hypothetical protein
MEILYSNDEGRVNRLKLIKRMGYGRMKFDLLWLRVVVRPQTWTIFRVGSSARLGDLVR